MAAPSQTKPKTVLIVDDEPAISSMVAMALRYEGFTVEISDSGIGAIEAADRLEPDVVLLDIMLPDIDGHGVLRRLRTHGHHSPVLFLTARDAPEERVHGLKMGADDYICKPFSIAELVARVHVALRRTTPNGRPNRLTFADLVLNQETFEVFRAGIPIALTATEFKLLRYLMLNVRRVLSKQQILDYVWDYDFSGDQNVVETYISYLRKKIDCFNPPLIHTVRGFGYCLKIPRDP